MNLEQQNQNICPVCGNQIKQDICLKCMYVPPSAPVTEGNSENLAGILNTGHTMIGHFNLINLLTSGEYSGQAQTEVEKTIWKKLEKQETKLYQIVAGFEDNSAVDVKLYDYSKTNPLDIYDNLKEDEVYTSVEMEEDRSGEQIGFITKDKTDDQKEESASNVTISDFEMMASLLGDDEEEEVRQTEQTAEESYTGQFMSGLLGKDDTEDDDEDDGWGEDEVVDPAPQRQAVDYITDVLDENGDIVKSSMEKEKDLFSDRDHPTRIERDRTIERERKSRQMRSSYREEAYYDNGMRQEEAYGAGMVRPGVFSSPSPSPSSEFTQHEYAYNPSEMIQEDEKDFIYSEMLEIDDPDEDFYESDRKKSRSKSEKEKSGLFGKRKKEKPRREKEIREDNYHFVDKNVDSYYLDKDMPAEMDDKLEKKKMSKGQLKQAAIFGSIAMLGVGMMVVPFL